MRGEGFTKRVRACKMLTNSLLQTAPLSCSKVSYDTPIPRAQTQNRQLPGAATAWAKRHLPAPGASRAPKHLPQKAYLAVATVSLRNFFRKFVDSRAEPEPLSRLEIYLQKSEVSNHSVISVPLTCGYAIPDPLTRRALQPNCGQTLLVIYPAYGKAGRAGARHSSDDQNSDGPRVLPLSLDKGLSFFHTKVVEKACFEAGDKGEA